MWTETRLKFLAAVPITNGLGEPGQHDEPSWPRYIRTTDIAGPRALRDDTFASLPPELAHQAIVRDGDVLMSAAGSVGKTLLYRGAQPACYAGYLVRFRPLPDVDSRFITYWTETSLFLGQVEVGKVRSTIDNFSASRYGNLRLSVPDLAEQKRLADYLDVETARIDGLIARKRLLADKAVERLSGEIESVLRDAAARSGEIPLRHLATEVTVGIVVTPAKYYAEEGIKALRGINVRPGGLALDDLVYITPEGHALHPKSQLHAGDLVTVRTGQAGATAVIPPELDGVNCIDLLITRPGSDASSDFLQFVLNSDWCRKHVAKHSVGSIQGHFNVEALKQLPIPVVDRSLQDALVARMRRASVRIEDLNRALEEQIALLREHRQALITAAVTGQLDVAKAAA